MTLPTTKSSLAPYCFHRHRIRYIDTRGACGAHAAVTLGYVFVWV